MAGDYFHDLLIISLQPRLTTFDISTSDLLTSVLGEAWKALGIQDQEKISWANFLLWCVLLCKLFHKLIWNRTEEINAWLVLENGVPGFYRVLPCCTLTEGRTPRGVLIALPQKIGCRIWCVKGWGRIYACSALQRSTGKSLSWWQALPPLLSPIVNPSRSPVLQVVVQQGLHLWGAFGEGLMSTEGKNHLTGC